MSTVPATVKAFAEEALRLALALNAAEDIQWSAAPVLRPRDDTTERAKGGHGDPTPSITLDDRRLEVRAGVREAEAALLAGLEALRTARHKLEASIERWEGYDTVTPS